MLLSSPIIDGDEGGAVLLTLLMLLVELLVAVPIMLVRFPLLGMIVRDFDRRHTCYERLRIRGYTKHTLI